MELCRNPLEWNFDFGEWSHVRTYFMYFIVQRLNSILHLQFWCHIDETWHIYTTWDNAQIPASGILIFREWSHVRISWMYFIVQLSNSILLPQFVCHIDESLHTFITWNYAQSPGERNYDFGEWSHVRTYFMYFIVQLLNSILLLQFWCHIDETWHMCTRARISHLWLYGHLAIDI
jgi:hypothetical protein